MFASSLFWLFYATAAEDCSDFGGVPYGGNTSICCAAACGSHCGGSGCGASPGADACCIGLITVNGLLCGSNGATAPCNLPAVPTPPPPPPLGSIRFATSYGSHMVLQRAPQQSSIWGFVGSGGSVEITVSPGDFKVEAQVADGKWRAALPAIAGSTTPHMVVVTDTKTGHTATLNDVLFGDVWVCSGQSNMAFLLEMDMNGTALVKDADSYPNIRLFTSKKVSSSTPLEEQEHVEQPWSVGSSCSVSMNCNKSVHLDSAVGDDNWLHMSAVCWLYGREIAQETGLPVGLVNTNWGGTAIEKWTSADARAACPASGSSGLLYNGMISPLLNMTIGGVIWYQGESNSGDSWNYHGGPSGEQLLPSYACRFPSMIQDWRVKWSAGTGGLTDPEFPFGFVQLASESPGEQRADRKAGTRWAQTAGYGYVPNEAMPNTFMAVAADMADLKSPYGAVHFRWKQEVGRRLGLGGRAVAYGAAVEWRGPVPAEATQEDGIVNVAFDQPVKVSQGDPLTQWELCYTGSECALNSVDGWVPATAAASSSDAAAVQANDGGLVEVGSGFCTNWKELAHTSSPLECFALGKANSECAHGTSTSVSVGKAGGKRAGRCICGKLPCDKIGGVDQGSDGWDRYNVSNSSVPASSVAAVRYAWRDFACQHLNCSVYSTGGLPAAPFYITVAGGANLFV